MGETIAGISREGIPQKLEFLNFKEDKKCFSNITTISKPVVEDS